MTKALLAIVPAALAWLTAEAQGDAKLSETIAVMTQTIQLQSEQIQRCHE